jgi:hypothetical protein
MSDISRLLYSLLSGGYIMSLRHFVMCLGIVTVITLGASLDARGGCDNDCRQRFYHYFCDGGDFPCVKFNLSDCLMCNPAVNCDCDNSDGASSTCAESTITPSNGGRKYESCTLKCACGTRAVVESNSPGGNFILFQSLREVCLGL